MNALGQVTTEQTRNGVETISTRNPSTGWLLGSSSTAHAEGDTLIQNWSYRFDEIGNLEVASRSDAPAADPLTRHSPYDPLNRVRTAAFEIPSLGYDVTEGYDYDFLGNITAKAGNTTPVAPARPGPTLSAPSAGVRPSSTIPTAT